MQTHSIVFATLSLTFMAASSLAEDRTGRGENFASEGGLGTTRIVQECDNGRGDCARFGSGWAGDAHVQGENCEGQRHCTGFASDGGLGTTRISDDD